MAWHREKNFLAWQARRAERMSKQGRLLEDSVTAILQELKDAGRLDDFAAHPPHSDEDGEGKDFTAVKIVGGEQLRRPFGITISARSWNEAKARYRDVPQFCFPIGTNKSTIVRRVLELFESHS